MNFKFEHLFIPKIVENSNKGDFELDSVEIFDCFEFVGGCFADYFPKEESKFDWDSFSITKEMNAKLEYWILRFPEPTKEKEAKWGLILHKDKKPFIYYTFEKTDNEEFLLARYDKTDHVNLGTYNKETTEEEFVKLVIEQK